MEQKRFVWKTEEGRRIRNEIIITAVIIPIALLLGFYGLPFSHGEPLEARGMRMIVFGSGIAGIPAIIIYSWRRISKLKSSLKSSSEIKQTAISVCCPYCNNTFQIPQQNKPFRVKCPKCGGESKLG